MTGSSVLALTTGTGANTGVEWKLDGRFLTGHTYKATVWALAPAGTVITLQLGVAGDQASQTLNGNGAWQRVPTISWSPGADRTGVVLAVYRTATGGAVSVSLDDAAVWDVGTPDLDVTTSETIFDADSHIVATMAPPAAPGSTEPMITRTTRDVMGRPSMVTVNEIAGATGDQTSNLGTQTHFDTLGRTDYTVDPLSHKTIFGFDRLANNIATTLNDTGVAPVAQTDDHGVKTRFAYDVLGELTGMCPAQQVWITGCDETSSSNVQAWHWTYDVAGNQVSQVPPANTTLTPLDSTVWTYDGGGRLTSVTDQTNGGLVTHRHTDTPASAYDALGRLLVSPTYLGSGTGTLALQTTTTILGTGQVSLDHDAESGSTVDSLIETYDAAGRPDLVQRAGAPSVTLTDFNWNADGTLGWRVDGDAGAGGDVDLRIRLGQVDCDFRHRADGLADGWRK